MADSWADCFDRVHGEFPSSYANHLLRRRSTSRESISRERFWCVYITFVQGKHPCKSELWWIMVKRSCFTSRTIISHHSRNIFGGNALGHPSNAKRGDKTCRLFFKRRVASMAGSETDI